MSEFSVGIRGKIGFKQTKFRCVLFFVSHCLKEDKKIYMKLSRVCKIEVKY